MSKCAVCGRKLTSAASVAAGVGPTCGKSGGKGKRHGLPRLRKLPNTAGATGPVHVGGKLVSTIPIAEALATLRQIAEKSPTWEAVGQ